MREQPHSNHTKWTFSVLAVANILQGLAFYVPGIYLPSLATDLNLSSGDCALLFTMRNFAQVLGLLIMGHLSDSIDVHILLIVSGFGSALVVFIFWSFSKSFAPLNVFSLMYGFIGRGFESFSPRFATALTDDPDAELTYYGML
jgi:MFS family permease